MYGNVCHYMTMREQCMTIHDIMWQFMTGCANVWQCMTMYANAWAMYDRNGWQGIACRGSESQVPSLIDQRVTLGYSRSLFYFCAFFGWQYLPNIIWWLRGIPTLYSTSAIFQIPFCWQYFVTFGYSCTVILLLLFFLTIFAKYSRSVFYSGVFCCWQYLPNDIWWHRDIPAVVFYFCYFLGSFMLTIFGDSGVFPLCILLLRFFSQLVVDNIWRHSGIFPPYSPCCYRATARRICVLSGSFCPFSQVNLLVTVGWVLVVHDFINVLGSNGTLEIKSHHISTYKCHTQCHAKMRFLCWHM